MSNKLTNYKLEAINYNKGGYSLIEVLVAIAMFSIAVAIATSSFVSSLGSQNRALSVRETIDNASHVMEYMSRALRMARKDKDGSCIDAMTNYKITRGGEGIKFENYQTPPVCQEFYRDTGRLYESRDGVSTVMTSEDLEVNLFKLEPSGQEQSDDKQPRATILIDINTKDVSSLSKVRIQTTISQRNLDIMQ